MRTWQQNMNLRLSADGNFFSSDSSGFGEYDGILSGSDYPGQQVTQLLRHPVHQRVV